MEDNPYKSPLASVNAPGDKGRRALVFWLAVLSGWMWLVWLPLIVGYLSQSAPLEVIIVDTIIFLAYAICPVWIAGRVHRGQGIKATRYLLLSMIPFVAGEFAAPAFAIVKGTKSGNWPIGVWLLAVAMIAHVCCYFAAWRCLIRVGRQSNSKAATQ